MKELWDTLIETPPAMILLVVGIILVVLSLVEKIPLGEGRIIRVRSAYRKTSLVIGFVFVSGGVIWLWVPEPPTPRAEEIIITETVPPEDPTPDIDVPPVSPSPSNNEANTIAITEIMFTPEGPNQEERRWNEYIEILNYGDKPVDVSGWFLTDGGDPGMGQPDRIIPWDERFKGVYIGDGVVTDTTIIQPGEFGLILAPKYVDGDKPYKGLIPSDTVILTIVKPSAYLGDDERGLVAYVGYTPDVIVLYIGTITRIEAAISTYGAPIIGASPFRLPRGGGDSFPLILEEYGSVARIDPQADDRELNWEIIDWDNATPGW